jgi:hypothetical protein
MRPAVGEVLHFSEDPTIEIFRPHVAKTASQATTYFWAQTTASTLEWSGIRLRNAKP